MPIIFAYQPTSGPLSGAEFEKQTVAFFEAVRNDYTEKMADFSATVDQIRQELATIRGAVEDNANAITALQQRCTDIEADVTANAGQTTTGTHTTQISTLQGSVSTLQTTVNDQGGSISALQSAVESLQQDGGVPAGFIGLYNSTTPPTGFAVCDGTGGTPKLTGYTAGTLRYIRKS